MNLANSALLTDLYQLTMLQTYHAERMQETAVFRTVRPPATPERAFLLAAGLEQAWIIWKTCGSPPKNWTGWLATAASARNSWHRWKICASPARCMRCRRARRSSPTSRSCGIVAPLPEAQLVESRLINLIHYQTLIASKAARCVLAAPGKLLVDFGMRCAHGAEAALFAARAAYLAGFAGSATVLAGMRFDIPVFGTMAHSLIQAHDREEDAFEHFAAAQPGNVVLLLDTYDTETAARKLVALAPHLRERGIQIRGRAHRQRRPGRTCPPGQRHPRCR